MSTKKEVKAKLQEMIDRLDDADEKWHANLAKAQSDFRRSELTTQDGRFRMKSRRRSTQKIML